MSRPYYVKQRSPIYSFWALFRGRDVTGSFQHSSVLLVYNLGYGAEQNSCVAQKVNNGTTLSTVPLTSYVLSLNEAGQEAERYISMNCVAIEPLSSFRAPLDDTG